MSNEIILASLVPVVEAFEQLGIDYYVGGSVASLMHGIFRTTADVDIIAGIRIKDIEPLVLLLLDAFYIDADSIKEAIKHRSEFSLLHFNTMFKVDVSFKKIDRLIWRCVVGLRKEHLTTFKTIAPFL